MLRAVCACGDKRQVDVGAHNAGQLDLSLFSSLTQTLHSHTVGRKVDAFGFLEFVNHPVHNLFIKVIAAQMGITIGGLYLEYAVADIQDGYIESAAAKVINHDGVVVGLVNAIGQGCGSRLVNDTQNIKACDLACVLGCLTLAVVEICRNGDNCLGYGFAQVSFGVSLQLLQDHCGNFFRGIFFVVDGYPVAALAHMTLNGADGSVRVGNSLTLCQLANQTLAVFSKANYGRGQTAALLVGDDGGFAALHNCNNTICST